MKQIQLPLLVLLLAAITSAQPPPKDAAFFPSKAVHVGNPQTAASTSRQDQGATSVAPTFPSYPDTTEGLERMMADMVSLQRQGQTAALTPYLQALVLPEPEAWFTSKFGDARCSEKQFSWNDCLGPRLALSQQAITDGLPGSFALTLRDLNDEGLTNFEAVNYSEDCAGPRRIVTDGRLVSGLTTTILMPTLVKRHEPVYALWIYSEKKETILAFFVYSGGAFRYVGMPHEASVEAYQKWRSGGERRSAPTLTPRYLTEDQLEMERVVIDPTVAQRTVVLRVAVASDGKVRDVSYLRGSEAYKNAAIQSVRKQKFDPPGFGPRGFHGNSLCLNVAPPR